jgi:hypothetical protein
MSMEIHEVSCHAPGDYSKLVPRTEKDVEFGVKPQEIHIEKEQGLVYNRCSNANK